MAHTYEKWRHGGWYVTDVHYPSGASGCVSRNFPDGKWRIVCDRRPAGYEHTYPTREAAADAEAALIAAMMSTDGTQRVWHRQFTQAAEALLPWKRTTPDEDTFDYIDPEAPPALVAAYQSLASVGYAKGWMP